MLSVILSMIDGVLLAAFSASVAVISWATYLGPELELADLRNKAASIHGFSRVETWEEFLSLRASQLEKEIGRSLGLPKEPKLPNIRDAHESRYPALEFITCG